MLSLFDYISTCPLICSSTTYMPCTQDRPKHLVFAFWWGVQEYLQYCVFPIASHQEACYLIVSLYAIKIHLSAQMMSI